VAQTHKLDRRIFILLYGSNYWNELINSRRSFDEASSRRRTLICSVSLTDPGPLSVC